MNSPCVPGDKFPAHRKRSTTEAAKQGHALQPRSAKSDHVPPQQELLVSAAEFSEGQGKFLFQNERLSEVTPDGDIAYERVVPAHPSDSELTALAGKYDSGETGSTLTVTAKAHDLTLAIGWNKPVRLRPTFRDAFMMESGGGATSIVFHRDQGGKVIGLSAGDDRVWDLRFTRIEPAAADSRAPK